MARNPVIVVPVHGQIALALRCLRAIDRHTYVSVPVLVIDDCGPEQLTEGAVSAAVPSGRRHTLVRHDTNLGLVATMNEAFSRTGDADVVLVNSDVTVLDGWLRAMGDAMSSIPRLGSASALADHGGILSVPGLGGLKRTSSNELAARLNALRATLPTATPIPVAVGHCAYFARGALDETGGFDDAFSPGYGEEVDWSLRARRGGWSHVAALHCFVWHEEGASFGNDRARIWLKRRHEMRIAARYPRSFAGIRRFARSNGTQLRCALQTLGAAMDAERPVAGSYRSSSSLDLAT